MSVPEPQDPNRPAPFLRMVPERSSSSPPAAEFKSPRLFPYESLFEHERRSRRNAFLLCLFLGWMGCHRFYVGKRTTGRIYLMTSGIFFLGVLVDLVLIAAGTFTDRFGRPLE